MVEEDKEKVEEKEELPSPEKEEKELDKKSEMPFLEHLEELRQRLIWSTVTVMIASVISFILTVYFDVIPFLIKPVEEYMEKLTYLSPTEPFMVTMKVSLFLGIVISLPILFWHFWAFVAPALFKKERKVIIPAIVASVMLFAAGVALAFYVVLPLGLRFLLSFQTEALTPMITINEYLSFATRMSLVFGTVFELPLVILILSSLGIVSPTFLRSKWRHVAVIICILAAILTPADPWSMTMMAIPLYLLYEVSIVLSRLVYKERK